MRQGGIKLATPGSTVSFPSVARHIIDCTAWPSIVLNLYTFVLIFSFSKGYLHMASASLLFNPDLYIILKSKFPNAEAHLYPVESSLALVSI